MGSTRIAELASLIQDNTTKVDAYLRSKGLSQPSFDEDGPVDLGIESEEIKKAVDVTRESSLELHDLLLGPGLSLRPVVSGLPGFPSLLNSSNLIAVKRREPSSHIQIRHSEESSSSRRNNLRGTRSCVWSC